MEFTKIGAEYYAGDNGEAKENIINACRAMVFQPITPGKQIGYMQGMAIKGVIKEFKIPAVAYCDSGHISHLPSYGFYGIEAQYKNERRRIYFIDSGVDVTPVCTEGD